MKYFLFFLFIIPSLLFSQTKSERAIITKNYDFDKLNTLLKTFQNDFEIQNRNVIEYLKKHNLSRNIINNDGSQMFLYAIRPNGTPIYLKTFNASAARSTRANLLYTGGGLNLDLNGENMVAHVWDGGHARITHDEFDLGSGQSKITIGESLGATFGDHATHVVGTICAIGVNPDSKGMAPQSTVISYDWGDDIIEATIASQMGMLISNHSYGASVDFLFDWEFGAYVTESRRWDNLMFYAPYYLTVCAAGNDGFDSSSNSLPLQGNNGYDKLSYMTTSKNSLVVANANDLIVYPNGDIVLNPVISGTSSQGPTDDFRIKPDISGNGTSVLSSMNSSDSAYIEYSGTSMASPNVTGSLLLIQQLYNEEKGNFMLAASLKGLALHTADDFGMVGPDAITGWGYLNVKEMAEHILDPNAVFFENSLLDGESFNFNVVSNGTEPLEVSISWTDPPSDNVNSNSTNDSTPVLVNDLDVRVEKAGVIYEPWMLTGVDSNSTGDNIVDPYEKIEIPNASGTYSITINHKGNLLDGNQNYTIIVSGISSSTVNSVNDYNLDNKYSIWPNPAKDVLYVKNNMFLNATSYIVTDLTGRKIMSKKVETTGLDLFEINLTSLKEGIYIIAISNDDLKNIEYHKFIIN